MAKEISNLQETIASKVKELEAFEAKATNGADLDEQDAVKVDALLAEIDGLETELGKAEEAAEKNRQRLAKIGEKKNSLNGGQGRKIPAVEPNDTPAEGKSIVNVKGYKFKFGKLKAFDDVQEAYRAGKWALAICGSDGAKAYCRANNIPIVRNALGEGTDTLGGYLVPPEWTNNIIILRELYGVFRKYCTVVNMARDVYEWPRRVSGIAAYWVGESGQLTESDPVFDMVQLIAKKLACLTLISTELDEDSIVNIGDYVINEMAYAFSLAEDTAGFTGNGTSANGGIQGLTTVFQNNSSYVGAYQAASAHAAFSTYDNVDMTGLMGTLPQYAHNGAKFYCSQAFHDQVFNRLAMIAGGNTVLTLTDGMKPSYAGYEIVTSQVLPFSCSTSNQAVCFFGRLDLAAALGDRRNITVMRSDDRYFEYDQIGIKATERIDINVHDIGNTTVAGPIAALISN